MSMKFFRDPVHDIIRVEEDYILELVDTFAMQRLRKIRQLGLAWLVYPGAEHSRFSHSLGTYFLAKKLINHFKKTVKGLTFNKTEEALILSAALLHDVGHGPFSHLFEVLCKEELQIQEKHEQWTKKIVLQDKSVNTILKRVDPKLPNKLVELFDKTITPHFFSDIISSQLDVDRFDYLMRDTYMTGAQYGKFDQEWIFRSLTIEDVQDGATGGGSDLQETIKTVVIDGRKGLNTLEQHILGRHFMYRNVYFHKKIRAAEAMLRMILKRAIKLVADGKKIGNSIFQKLAKQKELNIDEYMRLNDFLILSWVEDWASCASDKVLKDLSFNFIRRKLFSAFVPNIDSRKKYADLREKVKTILGDRYPYYFVEDEARDIAFKDFFYYMKQEKPPQEIWYLDQEGRPQRLSGYDGLLMKAKDALKYDLEFWHMPKETKEKMEAI